MNKISFIADHHSGSIGNDTYAKSQHLTWIEINEAHRQRWDFISSLNFYGGYNFYIQSDGSYKQFRAIGEETAAQIGFNFNCVSICLAGNFTMKNGVRIEQPTTMQLETRKKIINQLISKNYTDIKIVPGTVIDVSVKSIHPHSFYQQTACNCFIDGWGQELMKETDNEVETHQTAVLGLIDAILLLITKLKGELQILFTKKKFGAMDRSCDGRV